MNADHPNAHASRRRGPALSPDTRRRLRLLLPAVLVVLAAVLHVGALRVGSWASSPYPVTQTPAWRPGSPVAPFDRVDTPAAGRILPSPVELRRGETLGTALERLGATPQEVRSLAEAMAATGEDLDPRRLRPDYGYVAWFDDDLGLAAFEIALDGKGRARFSREGDRWSSNWRPYLRSLERRTLIGELDGSLEGSIRDAGGDPVLAYRMADVLQWDLDFNRDLQPHDRFEVVYDAVYLEGEYHNVGTIHALAYENGGRRLEAYRWGPEGEEGYYDGEGRPLQKLFLRSPLPYSRVTSRFSLRRFHPVLKRYRPHYGVDYGAPVGTPVRVTANGVVRFAGWDNGGGNMVKVSHPNDYLTAYLHLSRFAKGVRPGRRVRQGEVIGYVGATGLATAPHLDYRVQHRGGWIDPLTIKSVPADPIPEADLAAFLASRDRLLADLGTLPVPAEGGEAAGLLVAASGAESSRISAH